MNLKKKKYQKPLSAKKIKNIMFYLGFTLKNREGNILLFSNGVKEYYIPDNASFSYTMFLCIAEEDLK